MRQITQMNEICRAVYQVIERQIDPPGHSLIQQDLHAHYHYMNKKNLSKRRKIP